LEIAGIARVRALELARRGSEGACAKMLHPTLERGHAVLRARRSRRRREQHERPRGGDQMAIACHGAQQRDRYGRPGCEAGAPWLPRAAAAVARPCSAWLDGPTACALPAAAFAAAS